MYGYGRNHYDRDDSSGCLGFLLFALYAMPILGAYLLLTGKDIVTKLLGGILLVVGIVLWISALN